MCELLPSVVFATLTHNARGDHHASASIHAMTQEDEEEEKEEEAEGEEWWR